MKTYNRSLDLLALAMVEAQKGNAVTAAKLLVKASIDPSAKSAVAIIEASNDQAFAANARDKIKAKAKAKVKAAEDDFSDIIGDDEPMEDEDMEDEAMPEAEEDMPEAEEDMDGQIASVLASMLKTKAKPKGK